MQASDFHWRDGLVPMPYAPRTPEWVTERVKHVGASEIGALIGVCPPSWQMTPLRIYREKTGEVEPNKASWVMDVGSHNESLIARKWAEREGVDIIEVPTVYDRDKPWRAVSLDRIAFIDGEPVIVEIKWSGETFLEVPAHYACQILYQMAVTGIHKAIMVAASGRVEPYSFPVEWRPELAEHILEHVDLFWNENVLARVPPDPTSYEERMEVAKMLLAESDKSVEASLELDALIDAAIEADEVLKDAETEKRDAYAALTEAMAEEGVSRVMGSKGVAKFNRRKGSIRYAQAVKRLGIAEADLEVDRGPDTSFVTISKPKGGV